jgi:hypothetical protein
MPRPNRSDGSSPPTRSSPPSLDLLDPMFCKKSMTQDTSECRLFGKGNGDPVSGGEVHFLEMTRPLEFPLNAARGRKGARTNPCRRWTRPTALRFLFCRAACLVLIQVLRAPGHELASNFVLEVVDRSARFFELAQYRFCRRQEGFSKLSQAHAAAKAEEKRSADFSFQLLNLLGQTWLGNMLFFRRSGKALDPSNSTEIPELMKFQFFKVSYRTRMSSIVRIYQLPASFQLLCVFC